MNAVMVRILGFTAEAAAGGVVAAAALPGLAGGAACCAIDGNAAAKIAAIRSKDLLVRENALRMANLQERGQNRVLTAYKIRSD